MGVSIDKGFDKRVELRVSFSGQISGQYTRVRLTEDGTGRSIAGFGSFPSSESALITYLGGSVPPGPVELSFISEVREGAFDGPVLETCTAHLSTIAR